ncbi:MAG: sirohydrochlorin nickelochelatase [Methanobacteriaceae archaeon]|nr:sirohydrochlorin nickelochelatase [Methanobacteriaceae archaeon]
MDTNSNSVKDTGILLIGHGSRLPYGKQVISEIADKYRNTTNINVEVGFMELAEPNIPTAFNKLAKTGVNKIIVTPVFLAHGVHTKRDIPTILGLEALEIEKPEHEHNHEHHHHHHHHDETEEKIEFDGEIIYTEPLGADDKIVEIVDERISEHL